MTQPFRSSSAASFIALASMLAGCAVHQSHVAAASAANGKADSQAGLATRALAALGSNNVPVAIEFAERAVARTPNDGGLRALLGNAYFAAGRFRSAEGAFKDSVTLDPSEPQIILKLALVEIAQGKNAEAVDALEAGRGVLDPSDYGLALALAGHPKEAVAILESAARRPGADATVRQNLALALALTGDWTNARTVAAQDVPAGQLDERIQQWMQFAKPAHAFDQVASLVGVRPSALDPGQPVQLALNKVDAPQLQLAATAVASQKLAPPAARSQAVAPKSQILVEAALPERVVAPVHAAAPVAPAQPTITTLAASAVAEAKAVLASFSRSTPVLQKTAFAPPRKAIADPRRGSSSAVVQLGAYGSPARVLTAWDGEARKFAALKSYSPMSARFSSAKGIFYRLSVQGFNSVGEANALCNSLRHQGGSCFVRNVAGDMPVQFASR